jgi:hypothetical protein
MRMMVPAGDRTWRLPDGHTPVPLAFSLKAWKPQAAGPAFIPSY